jgi:hypothetical protein
MIKTKLNVSFVANKVAIETTCNCIMCQNTYRVAIETKISVLDGEIIDYKKPDNLLCPSCKSPYLRWHGATLIPK